VSHDHVTDSRAGGISARAAGLTPMRSASSAASSSVPVPAATRNVVLVGHSGAGKTTLVEALLLQAGVVNRKGSVTADTTVSDGDGIEHRMQRSVNLAVTPLDADRVRVNLLDTPGYADFVGDLRAGLRAADAALFVVSAADSAEGVDGATQLLWDECASVGMPRAIVISRLDSPRADFPAAVAACQDAFGAGVVPLHLPLSAGAEGGCPPDIVSLLDPRDTAARQPAQALADEDEARSALIEGVIAESEDETLLERYLGGEQLDPVALRTDLETAVARGSFHPVLATCAQSGLGCAELLTLLVSAFPSPQEHPLPEVTRPDGGPAPAVSAEADGPTLAEVVKTTTDPYLGRVSIVRVFSGTVRADQPVHVSGHGMADSGHPDHDTDERVGTVASPLGAALRPQPEARAGDICALTKLAHAETGDTLSDRDNPLLMRAWQMPDPTLPVAIVAHSKADEDKLSTALARLVAEDPSMRLEVNAGTSQLVLWCMGEAHADVLVDRLRNRFGVAVDQAELRLPLRETFLRPSSGLGRNIKQSGGHGQYGVCQLEVEPLPPGSGFEFVDRIVGGVVPRQFIPSVEKGVRQQMERGVVAGYPLVDIRVTLVGGKAHSVDSSDMAFQQAAGLALKEAARGAEVALLEPVLALTVLVPDRLVGAVLSDLSGRRGRVVGTEPLGGGGRTVVRAGVPESEVVRYAIDLRSLTSGTGTFSRRYLRHEPMPAARAATLTGAGAATS